MRNQFIARYLLSIVACTTALRSLFDPYSMSWYIVVGGGIWAQGLFMAMGVLGVLLLLDVLINESLPERYRFNCAAKHRWMLWAVLGCLYAAFSYVLIREGSDRAWAAWMYFIFASGSMAVGFWDLHYKAHVAGEVLA